MILPTSSWSWSYGQAQLSSLLFALPRQLYSYSYDKVVSCRWRSMGENTSLSTLSSCISADFNMKLYHQAPCSHKSDVWLVSGWAASLFIRFQLQKVEAKRKNWWPPFHRWYRCKEWKCRYTAVCLLIEMWDCLPILVSAAISPQRTKIFNNTLDEEQQTLGFFLEQAWCCTLNITLHIPQTSISGSLDPIQSLICMLHYWLVYDVFHDQLVDIRRNIVYNRILCILFGHEMCNLEKACRMALFHGSHRVITNSALPFSWTAK